MSLDAAAHQDESVVAAWNVALHKQHVVYAVHPKDLQPLRGHPLLAHVTRHLFAFEDAGGLLALARGAY